MNNSDGSKARSTTETPRKSLLEIVLMPLVVALLGSAATFAITTYQTRTAKDIADAQRASAERMVQRQEAAQRVRLAKEKGVAADAYVWNSTIWGEKLSR